MLLTGAFARRFPAPRFEYALAVGEFELDYGMTGGIDDGFGFAVFAADFDEHFHALIMGQMQCRHDSLCLCRHSND